jgi:heme-degrading monooxygenase HmoA
MPDSRVTQGLGEVKGFVAFHLLRGPQREDHAPYSSHAIWEAQEDFIL